jgi:ribonuclease VapC
MVIDTSALLAILQDEPERRTFNEAIEAAETRLMSTATLVETETGKRGQALKAGRVAE